MHVILMDIWTSHGGWPKKMRAFWVQPGQVQVEATHGMLPDPHGRVVAVVGEGQELEIGKGEGTRSLRQRVLRTPSRHYGPGPPMTGALDTPGALSLANLERSADASTRPGGL
jgi:hypothetical protein